MRVQIFHVSEVLVLTIAPVVPHAVVRTIRKVVLLAVRVGNLLEVLGLEIVSWVLSPPLSSCSLLLLKPMLFLSCKLNIVLFESPLISSEPRVRSGKLSLHFLWQIVQVHSKVSKEVLPVVLFGHGVCLPQRLFLFVILKLVSESLRPFT